MEKMKSQELSAYNPAERYTLFQMSAGMVRMYIRLAYDACRRAERFPTESEALKKEALAHLEMCARYYNESRLFSVSLEQEKAALDQPQTLKQLDYAIQFLGLPQAMR